jgi:methyl-accepting chemotaxis protein
MQKSFQFTPATESLPRKVLTGIACLAGIVLVSSIGNLYYSYQVMSSLRERGVQLEDSQGKGDRANPVTSLSIQMSVAAIATFLIVPIGCGVVWRMLRREYAILAQKNRQLMEQNEALSDLIQQNEALSTLIQQMQQAGCAVTGSADRLATSNQDLGLAIVEQASSTQQIALTTKEIAATSRELAQIMKNVVDMVKDAAASAVGGQSSLAQMQTAIQLLEDTSHQITSKLQAIHEQSGAIHSVVAAIVQIADRTNLLSLNAAIEAEKAGAAGAGFSVVAREIRRLANMTSVSTLEIEHIADEMTAAVSAGMTESDRFSQQIRRSVETVRSVEGQLAQILDRVKDLLPNFEYVNEGVQDQAQSAQQIGAAMGRLNEVAQQTHQTLDISVQESEHLDRATQNLHCTLESLVLEQPVALQAN